MSSGVLTAKLNRARAKLLGTTTTDIPAPFRIRCECDHFVTGLRQPSSQQIACPNCGSVRFVLPVNVYPSTRSVRSEVVSGTFGKRLLAAARELLPHTQELPPSEKSVRRRNENGQNADLQANAAIGLARSDEINEVERPANSASRPLEPTRRRARQPRNSARQSTTVELTAREQTSQRKLPTLHFRRTARRTLTPFRLLMLGVILSAAATGWWIRNRNLIENARQTWRSSMDAAETAFSDGRLEELQGALQSAVAAAEILGRSDTEVQVAANLLLETQGINQLSPVDLYQELLSCYEKGGRLNRQQAEAAEGALKSGWYVFDCPVVRDDQQPSLVSLRMPLPVGKQGVRIEAWSTLLSRAAEEFRDVTIQFVAQVESCRPPENESDSWLIRLDPDSCTLLTSPLHAERAGLELDGVPSLRQHLEQQRVFIEGNDLFAMRAEDRRQQDQRQETQR